MVTFKNNALITIQSNAVDFQQAYNSGKRDNISEFHIAKAAEWLERLTDVLDTRSLSKKTVNGDLVVTL